MMSPCRQRTRIGFSELLGSKYRRIRRGVASADWVYRSLQWLKVSPYFWILVFFLTYYFIYFRYAVDLDDEGFLLVGADQIMRGSWPMADFFSYQPLSYFMIAGGMKIFGNSVISERMTLIVLLLATTLLLLYCSRRVIHGRWCLVPPVLFALAPGPWYKMFFNAHLVAVLATMLCYLDRTSRSRLAFVGLAIGLAVIGRIEAAIEALLICVPIIAFAPSGSGTDQQPVSDTDLRSAGARIVWILFSACVVPLALLALYYGAGKGGELFSNITRYYGWSARFANAGFGHKSMQSSVLAIFSVDDLFTRPTVVAWGYLAGVVLCLVNVARGIASAVRRRCVTVDCLVSLSIGLFGLGDAAYAVLYVWDSRLLQCFSIVYLNAVLVLQGVIANSGISGKAAARTQALALASLFAFVLFLTKSTSYSGSLTTVFGSYTRLDLPRLAGLNVPSYYADDFRALRKATSRAGLNDYLVPLFGGQTLAYVSALPNPTYYTWVNLELSAPDEEDRMISTFKNTPIRYFVIRRSGLGADGYPFLPTHPKLHSFLRTHYHVIPLGSLFVLLERNA